MSVPVFECNQAVDLGAPRVFLEGQLRDGVTHPACTITGSMMDQLIAEADQVQDESFKKVGYFPEADFTPTSTDSIQLVEFIENVSLLGHEQLLGERNVSRRLLKKTGHASEHSDDGYSNIVNVTLRGARYTTIFDPGTNRAETRPQTVGSISVIPSHLYGYYLKSNRHAVEEIFGDGLMLQAVTQFLLRGDRAGLPA